MAKKTRLVSLDISTKSTGCALFENGKLIKSTTIDCKKEKDTVIRIEDMNLAIIKFLNECKPDIVVIEEASVTRNIKFARLLAMMAGVVNGWSLCNYAEFVMLKPSTWRKLVCDKDEKIPNKRDECKQWAINKIAALYGLNKGDDEAEAILIGQARINEIEMLRAS